MNLLKRADSDSSSEKIWIPVEEEIGAYEQFISPLYRSHGIPSFLPEIYGRLNKPKELWFTSDGVKVFTTIDIDYPGQALGGWFMRLNPSYHPSDIHTTIDSISHNFRFVAWWVPPQFYTENFKLWLSSRGNDNGGSSHDTFDTKKQGLFFSTLRDVPLCYRKAVFGSLLSGARIFLDTTFGHGTFDNTSCDFHYPSQLKYSCLHCQIRHMSQADFPMEQRGTRYGLREIIESPTYMPTCVEYMICCNSYHTIWTAIESHKVPWKIKKTAGDFCCKSIAVGIPGGGVHLPYNTVLSNFRVLANKCKCSSLGVILSRGKFDSLSECWSTLVSCGIQVTYLGDESNFEIMDGTVDKIIYSIRSSNIAKLTLIPKHLLLESVEDVDLCTDRLRFNTFLQQNNILVPSFYDSVYIKGFDAFNHDIKECTGQRLYQQTIPSSVVYKVKVVGHHITISLSSASSSTVCQDSKFISQVLCREIIEIASQLTVVTGLLLFGVDIVQHNETGRLYVIDINHWPTYRDFQDFPYALMEILRGASYPECLVLSKQLENFEIGIFQRGPRWDLIRSSALTTKVDDEPTHSDSDLGPVAKRIRYDSPFGSFLKRCVSSIEDDMETFHVIERSDAYEKYLREEYLFAPLSQFLVDIFMGHPSANVNIVEGNYCVIDSCFGCWVIHPNPKYHPPNKPLCFTENFSFCSWWISPDFVSADELRKRLAVIARDQPLSSENFGAFDDSLVNKVVSIPGERYLCTIRDVKTPKAMQALCDLYLGAESFFKSMYHVSLSDLGQVDCHYPPARQYSTLHFHFRRKSTMNGTDLLCRHSLVNMISRSIHSGQISPNIDYFRFERVFEYPHHSKRAIGSLIDRNSIPVSQREYGCRTFTPKIRVVCVGSEPSHYQNHASTAEKASSSKTMFVAIDGVDGTGKTTAAKSLAQQMLNFVYYKRNNEKMKKFSESESSLSNSPLNYYCFRRVGMQQDNSNIQTILKTSSVICDRWLDSLAAYNIAKDPRIEELYSYDGISVPDLSILLVCKSDIRDRRLSTREGYMYSDFHSKYLDSVQSKFLEIAKSHHTRRKIYVLDTTEATEGEVLSSIIEIINQFPR